MRDSWGAGSETVRGDRTEEEPAEAPFPDDVSGTPDRGAAGPWLRVSCLGLVLAALAGGVVWLFRDDLFHPFGDERACSGSEVQLPEVIRAGGAPIPTGASDVRYFTRTGSAEVTFVSGQIPDFLNRAGILPEGKRLFDEEYGTKGVADDEIELPEGLCGSSLRGPVWIYHSTGVTGSSVNVMVERSPTVDDGFRFPARAVVTYSLP